MSADNNCEFTWTVGEREDRYKSLISVWQASLARSRVLETMQEKAGKCSPHRDPVSSKIWSYYGKGMKRIMQDVRYLRQKGINLKELEYGGEYVDWDRLKCWAAACEE